jgi:hypothetical protein
MDDKTEPHLEEFSAKDAKAIGLTLLFLAFGIGALWAVKNFLGTDKDAVFVSILLLPALLFLILSGRITGFKAPGGLEANFAAVAEATVKPAAETVSVQDMEIVAKAPVSTLKEKWQNLNEAFPIVMTMSLGKSQYYTVPATFTYLEDLSRYRNFKFVVFLDSESKFVAYMPAWSLKGLLSKPELGQEFINDINEDKKRDLFTYPGVIKETISVQSTNTEALQEMTKQNLEALVVIDNDRKLKGVVEREQILSKMMLALAK